MKIAFTFNLKTDSSEDSAEFDTKETVDFLVNAISANGHECVPVEVGRPVGELVEELRSASPDLIFNTAEGSRGKHREALYPALFDELGIPYTGSDAHCLLVTLDKFMTNLVVARAGIRVPRSVYMTAADHAPGEGQYYPFPCIVKPNFEGSSKGITDASVVTDSALLNATIRRALKAYPDGILVEEFIPGTDVAVPFIEGLGPEVMTPCSYEYDPALASKHRIYDFRMKNEAGPMANALHIHCPAKVPQRAVAEIRQAARRAVKALGLRNLARFDFRVRDDGTVFFIEANANPSLESGASLYLAAQEHGLSPVPFIGHVIDQAHSWWMKRDRSHRRVERARREWMAAE